MLTLCSVKEAAVVPMDVSTPEEVAPESNPAAEEPQTPVKPPKVPRLVAPYRYAAAQQCHRPLPLPLCSLSTFARESLRHTRMAGKTSNLALQIDHEVPHLAGCHDYRIVQSAQTPAGAACSTEAAIGTRVIRNLHSESGICR